MAKYTAQYACGHSAEVQLGGKHEEREKKLEWMSNSLCPDCYRAEQVAKAQQTSEALGLQPLSGTERQIDWAIQIRLEYIDYYMMRSTVKRIPPEKRPIIKQALLTVLGDKVGAKWWLDHRQNMQDINKELDPLIAEEIKSLLKKG